jgi:hypothetical protein
MIGVRYCGIFIIGVQAANPGRALMLKLCGFPISNYYNKVKLVLLEKGVEFEE